MRFTVGRKIGLGFTVVGLLVVAIFVSTLYTVSDANNTLDNSISSNKQLIEVDGPSVEHLKELNTHIKDVGVHINTWVYITTSDVSSLNNLIQRIDTLIPQDILELNEISKQWPDSSDIQKYERVKKSIEELAVSVTQLLELYPDYNTKSEIMVEDPITVFAVGSFLDEDIMPNIQLMEEDLKSLLDKKTKETNATQNEMNNRFAQTTNQFSWLFKLIIGALILLALGITIIALFTTKSITKPVIELRHILVDLGKGIFPNSKIDPSNDEIGEMSEAMNQLVVGLKGTTNFANEVGKSNFNYPYEPLSDDDVLGHALVKMKDELAESERILEQKVKDRTAEVVQKKEEIEHQNEKLEELYQDITASIRYAKRLQDSILPTDSYINKLFPHCFVLFKPKDIVSGDFYWFTETENKVVFSAVDCTGHGVPGAFMSLIGSNALDQIVNEKEETPSVILEELNRLSSEALNKSEEGRDSVRDGMDMAMCAFSKDFKTLEYSGANNPLYIIRDNEIQITKADKHAIASFEPGTHKYTNHKFDLKSGDVIYVFSDGYADQFGGVKGKKFMYRQFRELLLSIKDKPMQKQKDILDAKIKEWQGSFEQVDDILVIGVRIP